MSDVERVGGKNASLGEMISQLAQAGIRVPGGFATTADAFRSFLSEAGLEQRIAAHLERLDPEDVNALTRCGAEIRSWISAAPLPKALLDAVSIAYRSMMGGAQDFPVAVRSSANRGRSA